MNPLRLNETRSETVRGSGTFQSFSHFNENLDSDESGTRKPNADHRPSCGLRCPVAAMHVGAGWLADQGGCSNGLL